MSGRPMSSTTASGSGLGDELDRLRAVLGELHLVLGEHQRAPQRFAHRAVVVESRILTARL